ncbi:sugar transporter, partial [Methylobacterium sp. A54F]
MLRNTALRALIGCLAGTSLAGTSLLGGCSVLPASGPTARAVEAGAAVATSEGVLARYEIVDINAATVE